MLTNSKRLRRQDASVFGLSRIEAEEHHREGSILKKIVTFIIALQTGIQSRIENRERERERE